MVSVCGTCQGLQKHLRTLERPQRHITVDQYHAAKPANQRSPLPGMRVDAEWALAAPRPLRKCQRR
jgi:hypothetical protein